ncbi:MAG: histone deacetylase [Methanomicrobiales archaeon]|nr:histone deacetylase [Methanomicrobiales archaeon]
MSPVTVITGDLFRLHDCRGHPETQERLVHACSGIPEGTSIVAPVMADREDLLRVHTPVYVDMIEDRSAALPEHRCQYLDPDTYITCHSFEIALWAAGAGIQSVRAARDGVTPFALIRPPGHHAGSSSHLGFCIFNTAAVAAASALRTLDRVAIVDWDVHHGNGTQEIFYFSDRVLYCSVHQEYIFPGTGRREERGAGPGEGYTLNAPLPAGSTLADYRTVILDQFLPAVLRFDPGLIIISAGQDCLSDDPLGNMALRPDDLGTLASFLAAPGIPLALLLEGGYGPSHPEAIAAIIHALEHA